MDFKTYKFPANEIISLVSKKRGSSLPTQKQTEKAINSFSRDNLLALPATDIENMLTIIQKYLENSSVGVGTSATSYLMDVYLSEMLGIHRLPKYEDNSSRQYQLNGTKNEKVAIEMLSNMDNFEYIKNRKSFENDYFVGIPDVLSGHSVFEIKTRQTYADFLFNATEKPGKSDFYQLQCEMDVTGIDEGELIYVATGVNSEDRAKYLDHCRKSMEERGMSDTKVEYKLQKIEKSCNLDWLPENKRVKRYPVKKNPEFIRLAKTKITIARNWMTKLHEKFEKM